MCTKPPVEQKSATTTQQNSLKGLLPPKAVIFDWDNTLVDTYHAIWCAMNETLTCFGHPTISIEDVYANQGESIRDFFPKRFGEQNMEAQRFFQRSITRHSKPNLRIFDHAIDLLKMLHTQKVYMAVVSNKQGNLLRIEADILKVMPFFKRMIGSEDTSEDKPSALPLLTALSSSGIEPGKDVWFVGDSEVDMQCAHNAGCRPILINRPLDFYPNVITFQNCHTLKNSIKQLFLTFY